jgi:hypothetical protein
MIFVIKAEFIFHQALAIWLMECVDYDNNFQLQLCNKFPLWAPPPKKPRASGKTSPQKSKLAGRKRKREESPDLDNDSNEDEGELEAGHGRRGESEVSEDEEVLTYRPRGTRSRPIDL